MKILAISEHFRPRVGGTVSYVERTCEALARADHQVELLVPGKGGKSWDRLEYAVNVVECDWPEQGDPDRETRYHFARQCSEYALEAAKGGRVDVVHVLFGLFVNEVLDTAALRSLGVPSVTTIHNVPPQECGRSWPGDSLINRLKDKLRLHVVAAKNAKRLQAHDYDVWVVPSAIAGGLLQEVRPDAQVEVIGHGYSGDLLGRVSMPESRMPGAGAKLRILTAGGWVPHKRQHLIPEVASRLHEAGIGFVWDLVGPPGRVPRYQAAIVSDIARRGMDECVRAHGAVPFDQFAEFYSKAHLYVQPSTEEGFCMTALDAAAVGLPVIGSPAGALPEICRMSEGAIVPSAAGDLAKAIEHFLVAGLWLPDCLPQAENVRNGFTWEKAAGKLGELYGELASGGPQSSKLE